MPVLLLNYDLHLVPGRALHKLIGAIKAWPCCQPTPSSWLIDANLTPQQVVTRLKPHLHRKDRILVMPVALHEGWGSEGLAEQIADWLRDASVTQRAG